GEFFGAFADRVAVEPEEEPEAEEEAAPAPVKERDPYGRRWKGYSPMTWISGGVLALMVLYAAYKYITGS
ncbi:MAG: hypothetical protein QGI28_08365, partial [Acidimicrobiales bacterium]|nr:hypothetical protein [Acidimicrobiales bacterium]